MFHPFMFVSAQDVTRAMMMIADKIMIAPMICCFTLLID
jgi:hypothetical protein